MGRQWLDKGGSWKNSSSWLGIGTVVILTASAGLAICLEKPTGSVQGKLSVEQPGFGINTFDIRGKKVYALAVGPRSNANPIERGVWVQPDGTFRIEQLPVGEYTLRLRAPGYATQTRSGVFIDEGHTTDMHQEIVMHPLEPSVNVASNSRVFTSKETPSFWLNSNGATDATVKIYKADVLQLMQHPELTEINRPGEEKQSALEFSGGDMSIYKPSTIAKSPFENQKPVAVLNRHLETDSEDWAHAEFKLNKPLPLGDYIAIAEVKNNAISNASAKPVWNVMWFNVTDIGLVMKQAPDKWVARAIDLNTLKPVSGVSVNLLDRDANWHNLGTAKTNADGFAEISLAGHKPKSYGYNFLAYATATTLPVKGLPQAQHTYGGVQYWRSDSDQYQTYFYTERPVYRLGQSVYFKGIVRKKDTDGFHNPGANLPVDIVVSDPDNNKITEFSRRTTAHGSIDGVVEIPADAKTGAYQITLKYPDGSEDYEDFEVAQYRKPEYQVDILPIGDVSKGQPVIAGDTVKARIRATYYFGAPVANAVVKYSIYQKPDWMRRYSLMPRPDFYGYFDSWDSEDNYESDYSGEYITEGYAQTDETGEAVITFQTRARNASVSGPYDFQPNDQTYKIQAEVTDLSRQAVIGSTSVPVSAGKFALFAQAEQSVYKSGENAVVSVSARDYQGKPVANQPVTVTLTRWLWDDSNEGYRGQETVQKFDVSTKNNGDVYIKLPLAKALSTDTYYVTVESRDADGHVVSDQTNLWVASEHSPYIVSSKASEKQPLKITLDKPAYRPGDTARVMISAPTSGNDGMTALVAIEGRKLHQYFLVPLTSTAQLVEIPVIGNYAPNAYVTVTVVGKKKQYYSDSKMLKVSPESHFMRLAVTTDKAKYHPGDSVTYTVQATDTKGNPVPNAEVSLGVVDESIYAIRPEAVTPINKFFYQRIENDVLTLNSFPEEYSAGPDKIEPRVRKDFRDMAAWIPTLLTNAQGLVRTTVKLPDNLTTWRATARAISGDADVGQEIQKIISTQDLIVRLALPRFYTQGDESLVTAIIHNYTETKQPISFDLTLANPLQIQNINANPLHQNITLDPDKATRLQWPVKAVTPGKFTIMAKAVGKTAGDALEQPVSVLPLGVEQTQRKSWLLTNENDLLNVSMRLPKGVSPESADYTLTAASSSIGPVLGNLANLVDYPFGCTEQTMSRLVPAALVMKLHRELNVSVSDDVQQKIMSVKNKAFGILRDHQNTDGGWGWWKNDASSYMMTSYVLEQQQLLQDAGLSLPQDQVDNGVKWLAGQSAELFKQLRDPMRKKERLHEGERQDIGEYQELMVDLAQSHAVLNAYGHKTSAPVLAWVKTQMKELPPEALAYWIIAMTRQGNVEEALVFYHRLDELSNVSGKPVAFQDWDHTKALMRKLGIKSSDYSYRYSGIESTVLGLKAMLGLKRLQSGAVAQEDVEAVKNWLLLQRGRDGWDNTKTTAQVLSALADEEAQDANTRATQFSVWVHWLAGQQNNREQTFEFNPQNQYQSDVIIWDSTLAELGLSQKRPEALLNIKKQGQGRLYLSQWLTYMLPLEPGQSVPLQSYPEGLTITREFFRLKPKVVDNAGTVRFSLEPLNAGLLGSSDIKSGESLLMQTNLNSPIALPYVMLNVPLPSGGEVVSDDPRLNLLAGDSESGSGSGWDFMNFWWTHQDILDDRMVFFTTQLPAGQSKFQAIVRMEMPGTMQLNPAVASTMYNPAVKAYSPLQQLHVVE